MTGPARRIGMIWAQADGGVIGAGNTLPWHLPEDAAHFRRVTSGGPVIMGRATWDSLPERFRPLPGRENVVVSRTVTELAGAVVTASLPAALDAVAGRDVWVIGGAQLYAQAAALADVALVTQIDLSVAGDAFAPVLGADWVRTEVDPGEQAWHTSATGQRFRFVTYERRQG